MDNRAAISAQAVDIQNDRQHKGFIKVTLHVPAEIGARLTDTLGWPTYTQPVAVALARLNPDAVKITEEKQTVLSVPTPRKPIAAEKRLAQLAGILTSDPVFRTFLARTEPESGIAMLDADMAADEIRTYCGVESRSEIIPGTPAADRFEKLHGAFLGWRDHDMPAEIPA